MKSSQLYPAVNLRFFSETYNFLCFLSFSNELIWFLKMSLCQGAFSAFFFSSLPIICFISFLSYVMAGEVLTASKVFTCVSLFSAVRVSMALYFPVAITMFFDSKVSLIRMEVTHCHWWKKDRRKKENKGNERNRKKKEMRGNGSEKDGWKAWIKNGKGKKRSICIMLLVNPFLVPSPTLGGFHNEMRGTGELLW